MTKALFVDLWIAVGILVGIGWIVRYVAVVRLLARRRVLKPYSYDGPPDPPPRVSIVIAAKDEENHIEACITGLLEQDYPDFEIIVVDDRSEDRTPEILRRLADQAGGRLRVFTVRRLPPGWAGKNHALWYG
ncbi:MAG: glycosyltransferase, partial [Planctomycetota bacterium]